MYSNLNSSPIRNEDSKSPDQPRADAPCDVPLEACTCESRQRLRRFGTENLRVISCATRNQAEADLDDAQIRLKVLLPFAQARLGQNYQVWDEVTGKMVASRKPIPLRPYVRDLANRLACGTDFIFDLVNRICACGPENARATDMLKQAPNGGKGTPRLAEDLEAALDKAVQTVCVEQGRKPGTEASIKEIRTHMRAAGVTGKLPGFQTIRRRSLSRAVMYAREDAYSRDHLNRIAGNPDEIQALMEVVMIDTTTFTGEDIALRVVDEVGRDLGPANVIFGIMGSNRGIWTFLGFAGAPNSYLSGIAIKRGLMSKSPLLERYGVQGILPFHGKPSEIRHDFGSEYVANHVQNLLKDMSIGFDDRSPKETPHHRGLNERFNRTAHKLFADFLNSTSGKRYQTTVRGKQEAIGITLDNLDRALLEWIVCDYHQRPHKGLGGDSPISRFEKFAEGGNGFASSGIPTALEDSEKLKWDFLWKAKRTVNHLGISFMNRRYSCSKLTKLFALNRRSSECRIEFRFNPYRMGSIFIKVPDAEGTEEIVEVPWIPETEKYRPSLANQNASKDPSIWEWRVLCAEIRRAGMAKPTGGFIEKMHQKREKAAEADKPVMGAPNKKSRSLENRNRAMRKKHSQEDLPSVASQQSAEGTNPENAADTLNYPFTKSRSNRLSQPAYLPIGDGADAY